jgi:hypothetical protein
MLNTYYTGVEKMNNKPLDEITIGYRYQEEILEGLIELTDCYNSMGAEIKITDVYKTFADGLTSYEREHQENSNSNNYTLDERISQVNHGDDLAKTYINTLVSAEV